MQYYKNWYTEFHNIFNESYQCYLNNISSIIFMNNFLSKVIKITESSSGFIASLVHSESKKYLFLDTIIGENETIYSDLLDNDIDAIDMIFIKSIKNNKLLLTEDGYSIAIPTMFLNETIGVIFLTSKEVYTHEMISSFNVLGGLIGFLQHNNLKLKKTSLETDNKFITYQIFEHLLNYTRDGAIVVTNTFDIVYINQNAINIINMVKKDKNPDNLLDFFPQLNILCTNNTKLFRDRKININIENNRSIMCPFTMEFIVNSVICYNTIYHLVMIYNNGDNVSLEYKNHTNFIAYLSHELRNPLQSINLANYLLQCNIKNVNYNVNNVSSYLNTIARSCHEMNKIINDILDLSKIEAHEFIIELDVCNIRKLVNEIVSEFPNEEKIIIEIDDSVPKTIYTDEVRLSQILSNLISNAVKFGKSGEIKINVQFNDIDSGVTFSIIDNGEGIKREEMSNLFKPFCQTSCSEKFKSNGLGLYVSQQVAHLLGGHISVVSQYKKGSTFTLFHPIKLENSGIIFEKQNFDKIISGNILIVDDNESNLVLFRLMLEHFNYEYKYNLEVHTVKDGKDAIDICKVNNYNLIFMDINMPGIDGCTASKLIKLNGFYGKIIATTGNILSKKENMTLCSDSDRYSHFDDVIIKPYDNTVILKVLNKYL